MEIKIRLLLFLKEKNPAPTEALALSAMYKCRSPGTFCNV